MNKHIKNKDKVLVINALNRGFEAVKPLRKNEFLVNIRAPRISAREFLLNQIVFVNKWTWILMLCLIAGSILIISTVGNGLNQSLWNIGAITPFLAMASLIELTKSDYYKMFEIEQSCLYNRQQLILVRFIILGVSNFVTIMLIASTARISLGQNILHTLMYLMIPYMLTCIISLNVLKNLRQKDSNICCSAISGMVAISYMIISNLYSFIFNIKFIGLLGIFTLTLCMLMIKIFKGYIYLKEESYDTYYR